MALHWPTWSGVFCIGDTMTRPGDANGLGGDCMSARNFMVLSAAGGVWNGSAALGDTTVAAAWQHTNELHCLYHCAMQFVRGVINSK